MSLLWQDNIIIAILFIIITAATLLVRRSRSDLVHFVVAAILGPIMEAICISSGAWAYSNPTYIIPFWLPLGWGLAAIIINDLVNYFTETLSIEIPEVKRPPLGTFVMFLISVTLISLFWQDNMIVTGSLFMISLITFLLLNQESGKLRFAVPFVTGPIMEAICISSGAWSYTNPLVIIPPWLPFIWGFTMLAFGNLSEYVLKRRSLK
jgi:hypothetical protein